MIFYFLISIVILAEIIITASIISHFLKWDKAFNDTNDFINELKPKSKDIMQNLNKISEQLVELAPFWVDKIKSKFINMLLGNIKNMLFGALFVGLTKKTKWYKLKKLRRSKLFRLISLFS